MEKFLLSTTIILIPSALFAVILPATPYTGDMVQNDLGSLQFGSGLESFEGPGDDLLTMDEPVMIEPMAANCYTNMGKSPQGVCSSEINKSSWAEIVVDVNMMAIECYTGCPENDCHEWFAELWECVEKKAPSDLVPENPDFLPGIDDPVMPAPTGDGVLCIPLPLCFYAEASSVNHLRKRRQRDLDPVR